MKCPGCGNMEDKVIDSRNTREGDMIRRRRECLNCTERFTTYERIEQTMPLVIKKDGRRENFDQEKIDQHFIFLGRIFNGFFKLGLGNCGIICSTNAINPFGDLAGSAGALWGGMQFLLLILSS